MEGLSTAETAACLDINAETVKTRLHRVRALLRNHINARIAAAIRKTFHFAPCALRSHSRCGHGEDHASVPRVVAAGSARKPNPFERRGWTARARVRVPAITVS